VSPDRRDAHEALVELDGHVLRLRNLDKVLYPAEGTTKAQVIDYYARVAPVLLPHLAQRPVSRFRWPDGVAAGHFVEKELPRGTPDWVARVPVDSPGSTRGHERVTYPLVDSLATLTWLVNLAALELHVPQWQVGPRGGVRGPDRLVVDLDPGAPAGLAECAEVALLVRERLADDGLEPLPVTSGSKGLQLYAPVSGRQDSDTLRSYARRLAQGLARDRPDLVVSNMAKALRPGKVLLDWSQNHGKKTTISPYSLRGRAAANVAAPRTWAEIEDVGSLTQLHHTAVLRRVAESGDLAAGLLQAGPRVPTG
jgi:bifunctional non-homologous end joining protein LigD